MHHRRASCSIPSAPTACSTAATPLTSLKPRAIKLIEDLNLPPHERDAVFWRNAARLLKLPMAGEKVA